MHTGAHVYGWVCAFLFVCSGLGVVLVKLSWFRLFLEAGILGAGSLRLNTVAPLILRRPTPVCGNPRHNSYLSLY